MSTSDVVTANTSFSAGTRSVTKGETFRASDPIVQGREECFDPFQVDNEIEQATAAPGEKRNARIRKESNPETTESADASAETTEASASPTDYSEMKQPELKALLDERGIDYPTGVVSNADLIALLESNPETTE
ncbi:MAG TPA: hypothetical protein VMS11_04700 [Solirubrobacterales bacterium]|nr:hypothetical protein [Solirubrobacterales bacterium]